MIRAEQPGAKPLEIPERVPNPATEPRRIPEPNPAQPLPVRREPIKVPEKVMFKSAIMADFFYVRRREQYLDF